MYVVSLKWRWLIISGRFDIRIIMFLIDWCYWLIEAFDPQSSELLLKIADTCAWLWKMSLVLQKYSICWFLYTFSAFLQLLRPIYKQIAENQNAEIFSANTLLVILGTSLLTARVWKLYILVRVFFFFSFCSSDNTLDPCFFFYPSCWTGWTFHGIGSISSWFASCRDWILFAGWIRYCSISRPLIGSLLYDGWYFLVASP